MMTPCEQLGWRVGDRFIAKGSDWFEDGQTVTLIWDDGDEEPEFQDQHGESWYEHVSKMTPIVLITANE